MLRLTAEQLTQALNGLNPSERLELLKLLEERERQEAERPVDTRPSFDEIFPDRTTEDAAASGDPEGYMRALAEHKAAVEEHYQALEKANPMSGGFSFIQDWVMRRDAEDLAERDGHGHPRYALRKPEPQPESDPLERLRRASLPRSTMRDIEDSRTRTAEDHVYEHIRAEQRAAPKPEVVDKLAPFRDQSPLSYPPAYPDS